MARQQIARAAEKQRLVLDSDTLRYQLQLHSSRLTEVLEPMQARAQILSSGIRFGTLLGELYFRRKPAWRLLLRLAMR